MSVQERMEYEAAGDIHVYPIEDLMEHTTDSADCPCDPRVEVDGARLIVIHNSYDGRESREIVT
jgi:hypothetical protein